MLPILLSAVLLNAVVLLADAAPLSRRAVTVTPPANLTVQLDYGSFVGATTAPYAPIDRRTTVRYHLGIPFAQPPVGNLRFKGPQPINTNYGVYNATQFAPNCMQLIDQTDSNISGDAVSEDCLYLNVWTPGNVQVNESLPVAVWIYGGSFINGASQNKIYDGANLVYEAMKQGKRIIVVAPNYRVNAFGFLASPQMAQEGGLNAGLQDQRAAFQWVRKYIKNFGGNPNQVTAWGQSAGAISLGFHMTATQPQGSTPLFDQAILQSGGAYSGPALNWTANYGTLFKSVATQANCSWGNISVELTCLRNLPAPQLLQFGLIAAQTSVVRYAPYIDLSYVTQNPEKALASGQFLSVPLMIGDVADEGTMFSNVQDEAGYNSYMANNFGTLPTSVSQTTYNLYPLANYPQTYNGSSIAPFMATSDIFGDFVFQCPVLNMAMAYAKFSTAIDPNDCKPQVFKYKFAYSPPTKDYFKGSPIYGTYHGSELKYVHADLNMADNMEQLLLMTVASSFWVSFITGGDPNGWMAQIYPIWPKYINPAATAPASCTPVNTNTTPAQQRFVISGPIDLTTEDDTDRAQKCGFWNQFEMGVSN